MGSHIFSVNLYILFREIMFVLSAGQTLVVVLIDLYIVEYFVIIVQVCSVVLSVMLDIFRSSGPASV